MSLKPIATIGPIIALNHDPLNAKTKHRRLEQETCALQSSPWDVVCPGRRGSGMAPGANAHLGFRGFADFLHAGFGAAYTRAREFGLLDGWS